MSENLRRLNGSLCALRADAVEPVQSGCMITISYGIHMASHGHTNHNLTVDTLMTPSDCFFDLLLPINSHGQSIASLLNHDYNIDAAEAVADTLRFSGSHLCFV